MSTSRLVAALLPACLAVASAAAAPLPRDRGAGAPALIARIDSLWNSGARDSSQALLERRLPQARATGDSLLLLDLLVRDGAHGLSRGAARNAEAGLREAVRLAGARADTARLCAAVRWLSVSLGSQGRMPEARLLYRRLLDLATAAGDRRHQGWARVGMAWDAWREGRAAEAVGDYRRAASLFRAAGEREGEIWAQNGLGGALSRGGDYAGAVACYRRAAELARTAGFATVEIMALNNLGSLEYGLGDPGRARARFARALDLARRAGQVREAVIPAVNLAICQADLGRLVEAAATLDSCLAQARRHGLRDLQAMALIEQAALSLRRGLPRAATRLYRESLALGEAAGVDVRWRALIGLSDALAAADSGAVALAVALGGARAAAGGPANELRASLELAAGRRLRERGRPGEALAPLRAAAATAERLGQGGLRVEALAQAAGCQRALERPDSALALLAAATAAWEAERGAPLDPEWRERRGVAGQAVRAELIDLLLGPAGAEPSPERVARAFACLQRFKARTLLERLTGPGGAVAADTGAGGRAADLAALQREVLRPDELLLDFGLGPEASVVFAVTRDAARAVRLPGERALGERMRLYHGLLAAPPAGRAAGAAAAAEAATAGAALARDLLGGVADLAAGHPRIVVAPDGAANLLPFGELLPGHEVVRVPSAAVLALLRARPAPRPRAGGLRTLAVAGGSDAAGRPLRGARREADALGRRYRGVTVRLTDDAQEPAAPGLLAGPDVLHLAAHLAADDQRPWRSRLRFGAADTSFELTAARVAELKLPARLAVLSSCGTAGGPILSGEGVLGMTGAFLGAGVPAVVATLWPVDDAATTRLMARFYAELSRGATVAAALRRAQQELRDDPATAHPFYWAGFVLAGDGSVTAPLARRRATWPWGAALVVLAGGALAGAARGRGRRH